MGSVKREPTMNIANRPNFPCASADPWSAELRSKGVEPANIAKAPPRVLATYSLLSLAKTAIASFLSGVGGFVVFSNLMDACSSEARAAEMIALLFDPGDVDLGLAIGLALIAAGPALFLGVVLLGLFLTRQRKRCIRAPRAAR
jgi:hypothetical protein